ncbi:hypothetical protein DR79_660 [Francisella tularensis]|uniref:Uncharacterized protein n=1 Tax=Francisella tularensis TaxID=263 RepID=A0AAW3D473_FRATU|nr:hypothetical protein BZ14_1186 [Francisella tularensis subsp. tularensis SCHU S4]AJI70857.1 hypothetical protein CH69_1540 [Francisella tularensis subsp. tularensis]KFJ38676.1 hypothetical protein DR85_1290 [Francisella tularensis]KFJ40002.1 hypothetical protein DR87_55 [Francisella tularensis]KFJ45400.1 hypothetical protein DR79_660 [Francisella tularensis]
MEYKYHHIGIPVTEPRPGERYSPSMDICIHQEGSCREEYNIIALVRNVH